MHDETPRLKPAQQAKRNQGIKARMEPAVNAAAAQAIIIKVILAVQTITNYPPSVPTLNTKTGPRIGALHLFLKRRSIKTRHFLQIRSGF